VISLYYPTPDALLTEPRIVKMETQSFLSQRNHWIDFRSAPSRDRHAGRMRSHSKISLDGMLPEMPDSRMSFRSPIVALSRWS
jgi:hypothetical protein